MSHNEVDKYVQEMITKMFPKHLEGMMNPHEWIKEIQNSQQDQQQPQAKRENTLEASIFETHDFVFLRIPIKDQIWLREMKIFHTSNEAIIENIPDHADKHTFLLPVSVRRKGATANHKDGVLEIKLPRSIQSELSEIDVSEV